MNRHIDRKSHLCLYCLGVKLEGEERKALARKIKLQLTEFGARGGI